MDVVKAIAGFVPRCEQEQRDREQMLAFMEAHGNWLTRDSETAHVTASAWVVDPERRAALMIYHNIYGSWAWTGGHADGDDDLLAVATREVAEETGAIARPVSSEIYSIESLCVEGHVKRGRFVSPHIHMNVTYLLEADPDAALRVKADENSGVMWVPFEEVGHRCSEPYMRGIYKKLIDRLADV